MERILFNFEECKDLVLKGLLEAFEKRKTQISDFPKHPIGSTTIHRMSLDIHPWYNSIKISFCHHEDDPKDVASWKYFDFIASSHEDEFPLLKKAADYITNFYDLT